jgi:hypothetical protein
MSWEGMETPRLYSRDFNHQILSVHFCFAPPEFIAR